MQLIINPSDIYYLTGVRSHDPGEVLMLQMNNEEGIMMNGGIIFCDARTSALFNEKQFQIVDKREEWKSVFSQYPTLETDPEHLTQSLREKIEGYGVSLIMNKSPITKKRILKTGAEMEILKQSQLLNKKVYEMTVPFLVSGVTEEEIARKIQIFQLELGATGSSFPPIVAFGENSAVPHHSPTQRKLRPDDIILLDMGLVYQGYCSDMTRMVYQTGMPDEARKIGDLVTSVTNEIIDWARPGMRVADMDKKARELLGEYDSYFTHSLGHGVGIDIHETPYISSKSDEILEPGMVITIEPGIYIPGKYGARYEEMCRVTQEGLLTL